MPVDACSYYWKCRMRGVVIRGNKRFATCHKVLAEKLHLCKRSLSAHNSKHRTLPYYYNMAAANVAFKAMLKRCGMSEDGLQDIFIKNTGMEDATSILTLSYKEFEDAIKYAGKAAIIEKSIISTVVRKKLVNIYPFLVWRKYRGQAAAIASYDDAAILEQIEKQRALSVFITTAKNRTIGTTGTLEEIADYRPWFDKFDNYIRSGP